MAALFGDNVQLAIPGSVLAAITLILLWSLNQLAMIKLLNSYEKTLLFGLGASLLIWPLFALGLFMNWHHK